MKKYLLILAILFTPLTSHAAFITECTGGVITSANGRTIHTFTSNGTFVCTNTGNVDYLVVAGGGAGGGVGSANYGGGGGGAGGMQPVLR